MAIQSGKVSAILQTKNFWKRQDNVQLDGFDFDRETFEDLIECMISDKEIPILLGCLHSDLDEFCRIIYGCDYKNAYSALLLRSKAHRQKAFIRNSDNGNQTAMNIVKKMIGLGDEEKEQSPIIFECNIPMTESDVEKKK